MCKIKTLKKFSIKSITNNGELAKQVFRVVYYDNFDTTLIIERLVLTNDYNLYRKSETLKNFKQHRLVKDSFGIKLKTITEAINYINKSNEN